MSVGRSVGRIDHEFELMYRSLLERPFFKTGLTEMVQQLCETNGTDTCQAKQVKGAPRNIWAFRVSAGLFSLWLAWLVYLAFGLLFG